MLVFGGRKWKAATKFKAISPKEWDEIAPNAKKHIQVATALNSKKPLQVGRWWFQVLNSITVDGRNPALADR